MESSSLASRVKQVSQQVTRLTTLRDRLSDELRDKESEVSRLTSEVEILTKVSELFRQLMDLLVIKQVQAIESLVTEGLRTIFDDLELSFEAEVGPKYNKVSVDFFLRQGQKDDPLSHRGKPLESFGGGPSSVASLILRILTILRLKRWPFIALDESLGAVSEEYTENTGRFLRALAEKMHLDVLLVTHKPSFLEHAHKSYRCTEVIEESGSRHLELKSV